MRNIEVDAYEGGCEGVARSVACRTGRLGKSCAAALPVHASNAAIAKLNNAYAFFLSRSVAEIDVIFLSSLQFF